MVGEDGSLSEAAERFRVLLQEQVERAKRIGRPVEWLDYTKLDRGENSRREPA